MKNILIVTTTLDLGGITSFVVNLTNFLVDEGHKVTLMYTKDKWNIISKIDKEVELLQFIQPNKNHLIFKAMLEGFLIDLINIKFRNRNKISPMKSLQRINYVRAINTKKNNNNYDLALSSAEFFCNTYVAFSTNATRKIGWIHPEYESLNIDINFDKETLDFLDNIVTISDPCMNSLINSIPDYRDKVLMIENIVDAETIKQKSLEIIEDFDCSFDGINIVTVCRLDNSSKRLDRAVKACKALVENNIRVKWYLIGEGKDEKNIKKIITELELENHFIMLGAKKNPYPYMKQADLFVLSSQYEGKPIVISEALILKCPVIVTNYFSAKNQVSEEYGCVLPNEDNSFVEGVVSILRDENKIQLWKSNLRSFKFENDKTYTKLRNLLRDNNDKCNSTNI